MKRNKTPRIVSIALCFLMLVQVLSVCVVSASATEAILSSDTSAASASSAFTYEQTFSSNPLPQETYPIFTQETPFNPQVDSGVDGNNGWTQGTLPALQSDGSLLFDSHDGLMFYWQNVSGFSADASKTYTIKFDVELLSNSDGTDIRPTAGWNRELYFGYGCYYNQVEFRSKNHKNIGIRAGDAVAGVYPNGGFSGDGNFALGKYSAEVVWSPSNQTVTSTVKMGDTIVRQGQRSGAQYNLTNAHSQVWGWRCEGGSFKLSNVSISNGTDTYNANFTTDFGTYTDDSSPIWSVETVQKQATAPDFTDGIMKMDSKDGVCFNWTNLTGVGEFDPTNTYAFEFDAKLTNVGNGDKWGDNEYHTRALYVGFGGYWNQVIFMSKGDKIDAGDTNTVYSEATYLNKTVHVSIVWEGTVVSSTITDETGKLLLAGSRTKNEFVTDMANMKYLVLRCEDGAVEIDNFKFSKTQTSEVSSTSINIPSGNQAIYECDINYDGVTKSILKLGDKEIFSVAPNALKLCQRQILGSYTTGTYKIKAYINPVQQMLSVEVIKPDGGVVRRALYSLTGGNAITVCGSSESIVSNEKVSYEAVTTNEYELTNTEPSTTGFAANVYNLVTSFNDAYTTRNFAWTAATSFIGDGEMAVKYRAQGTSNWTTVTAVKEVDHTEAKLSTERYFKCDISGLTPDTTYEYQIGKKNGTGADDWSKTYTFTTADKNMEGFKFLAVGDTQGISWGGTEVAQKGFMYAKAAFEEAYQELSNPAFIMHVGDVVEHGGDEQMWNWYFKALGDYGTFTPHFAAIGNHDARTSSLYFDLHFNHPNNGGTVAIDKSVTNGKIDNLSQYLVDNSDETIYSYNYGNAHFIVLNTGNYTADDEHIIKAQREWLKKDLEANKCAKYTIVTMHEPGYHRSVNPAENRPWFNDLFESYGVDLVIQGHSHLVTRSYPMKDGKIVSKSITDTIEQGVGTVYTTIGSTALNKDGTSDTVNVEEMFSISIPEKEQATYTIIEVNDDGISVVTKQLNGLVLDTFTITADEDKETAHVAKTVNAKPVSCSEDGYSGDKICEGCGELLEEGTVILASTMPHIDVTVDAKSATCKEDGYSGDKICEECGELLEEGTVIPKLQTHTFGEWKETKPATATEAGEKTRTCTACGEVENVELPKLNDANADSDQNTNEDANNSATDKNTDPSDSSKANQSKKSGCGSSITAGMFVIATVLTVGTGLSFKKKEY